MSATHFTAWMVIDPTALETACMDVTVLQDEITGYEVGEDGSSETETPVWSSNGDPKFHAVTTVDAKEGDAKDGIAEAEELLTAAGWNTVGEWEAVDNAYIVTVEAG